MFLQQISRWQTGTGPFWVFGPHAGRMIADKMASAAYRILLISTILMVSRFFTR